GEADGWWKVRTVDDARLRGAGIAAPGIEGLDVYALELYVPVGSGTALEADPSLVPAAGFGGKDDEPALDPKPESESLDDARWAQNSYNNFDSYEVPPAPLQGGGEAGKHDTWELDPGSDVFWPDGTLAGAVARAHAFLQPGKPRSTEAGELSCFEVRVGPGKPQAELCFEAQAVHHRQVESVVLAFADKPSTNNTKITKKNAGGFSTAKPTMPTSQVRLQSASSEGIDAEVTRRVVRSHLADVRHCYGVAMHAGLMPEGTLTLWASVDRKGEVIETSARGVDEIFATCVAEKAKDWRFPNGSPGTFSIAMECSLE
ncbi:MAG: hypothetical protein KC457_25790, partial [Myxococcales bacterium]|nr:hypothetical protein [Myxococcales bacterium]